MPGTRGARASSAQRALLLLQTVRPESLDELSALPLGWVAAELLTLRSSLLGPTLVCLVGCRQCHAVVESQVEIDQLTALAGEDPPAISAAAPLRFVQDDYLVEFRLPTSADLLLLRGDAREAGRTLAHALIVSASRDGVAVAGRGPADRGRCRSRACGTRARPAGADRAQCGVSDLRVRLVRAAPRYRVRVDGIVRVRAAAAAGRRAAGLCVRLARGGHPWNVGHAPSLLSRTVGRMSAQASVPAPEVGLFAILAERQLAQSPGTAPGALRPWLPYSFDGPPSRSELEPASVEFPSDAADVAPASPVPQLQPGREAEHVAAPPPSPVLTTPSFNRPSAPDLRPAVKHDVTPAIVRAEASPPSATAGSSRAIAPSTRPAHVSEVVTPPAPVRASLPWVNDQSQEHIRERLVAVPTPKGERSALPSLAPWSDVPGRDTTARERVVPRVPLPAPAFRHQREPRPEPHDRDPHWQARSACTHGSCCRDRG